MSSEWAWAPQSGGWLAARNARASCPAFLAVTACKVKGLHAVTGAHWRRRPPGGSKGGGRVALPNVLRVQSLPLLASVLQQRSTRLRGRRTLEERRAYPRPATRLLPPLSRRHTPAGDRASSPQPIRSRNTSEGTGPAQCCGLWCRVRPHGVSADGLAASAPAAD